MCGIIAQVAKAILANKKYYLQEREDNMLELVARKRTPDRMRWERLSKEILMKRVLETP